MVRYDIAGYLSCVGDISSVTMNWVQIKRHLCKVSMRFREEKSIKRSVSLLKW